MAVWRSAVLASLISGSALTGARTRDGEADLSSLGALDPAEAVDTLAAEFDDRDYSLAVGLDLRAAQLHRVDQPTEQDLVIASETMELLAPLAEHAGMSKRRALLEDASFRLLDPQRYLTMTRELPRASVDVDALVRSTRELLAREDIEAVITGRTKSLYSAHRKLTRKGLAPRELLDRTGLRIRVGSEDECYQVMALLHQRYPAIQGSFDDYITSPKPSGYQSLHTAVRIQGAPVEFQVRTHAMHAEAEHGAASHWRYKLEA